MKLGILTEVNHRENDVIAACEELNIKYELLDFVSNQWLCNINQFKGDGILIRASGDKETNRQMFEEKVYHLAFDTSIPLYPSYEAIRLYENKKAQIYWMRINNIKHPDSFVFYTKEDALKYVNNSLNYPIVFKPNIGAKANGVVILRNKKKAIKVVNSLFTRLKFFNVGYCKTKKIRGITVPIMDDRQFNYGIFQTYIDIKYEWRIIKVGNSYFGHQKLEHNGFHSGSGLVGWVNPPIRLLEMIKEISSKGNFNQMSLDVFEDHSGSFFVNEMQTYWGGVKPSQMIIDDKPCRYIYNDGEWKLEYGEFNQNRSWNLRVLDFVNILRERK
jgi:hypothetical protein